MSIDFTSLDAAGWGVEKRKGARIYHCPDAQTETLVIDDRGRYALCFRRGDLTQS